MLSIGFRVLVSRHPAIQTTGPLTLAPAGLSPAEHASLRWTHNRTRGFPAYGSPVGGFFIETVSPMPGPCEARTAWLPRRRHLAIVDGRRGRRPGRAITLRVRNAVDLRQCANANFRSVMT